MFPTLTLFGRDFGMYGICAVVGILLCGLVGSRLIKKFNIKFDDLLLTMLAVGAGLFLFAHIVYGITNTPTIILAFQNIGKLDFWRFMQIMGYCFGGMVFYGGFIGGAVGIIVFTKFFRGVRRENMLDVYAVLIPLFHTFGRIGCFLGGCCYGIPSSFGFTVHGNTINPLVNDVNRLPVQLFEAGCNLLIFFVLFYMFKKSVMQDRLIYVYMLIYPVVRFTLEFFRGDEYRGILFGLSTSQWISLALFVFSAVMLIVKHGKPNPGALEKSGAV